MAKRKADKKRYTTKQTPDQKLTRKEKARRILRTVCIVLLVAAVLFFVIARSNKELSLPENAIGSVITPIQNFFTGVVDGVKEFVTKWHNYDALQAEYETLEMENAQLNLELTNAEEAIQENERLYTLLDAESTYDSLDPIYARVTARDPGTWFTTFTLNRGTADGVLENMAVVNGDGLIGHVYEAGYNYCKVISIIDTRSSVACLIQRTRDNGIMKGQSASSDDVSECFVYYLPNVNNIVPGDTVVTSGTDSVYPKGLKVGTVTAVSLDAGSDGSYAVVSPSADFQHIEEVFILRTVVESDEDVLPSVATPTPAPYQQSSTTLKPGTTATPAPDSTGEAIYNRPTAIPADGSGTTTSKYSVNDLIEDEWASED